MYKSFEILNFRCFGELKIDSLERVNLIAGDNNVGKTALLEAIFLFCGAYRPRLVLSISAHRGIDQIKIEEGKWTEGPWDGIFRQFDHSREVVIRGENGSEMSRTIRLKELTEASELAELPRPFKEGTSNISTILSLLDTSRVLRLRSEDGQGIRDFFLVISQNGISNMPEAPAPPFPGYILPSRVRIKNEEIAERFSALSRQKKTREIVEHLKIIEPRLKSVSLESMAGQSILHADIGTDQLMPLPFIGEGTERLLLILIHLSSAVGGIVLIDEIENGFHHSILPKVWKVIGGMAREFNCQVFATTHSLECIRAAHEAFSQAEFYDFRLHRLDRREDAYKVVTYDREAIESSIETNIEVR